MQQPSLPSAVSSTVVTVTLFNSSLCYSRRKRWLLHLSLPLCNTLISTTVCTMFGVRSFAVRPKVGRMSVFVVLLKSYSHCRISYMCLPVLLYAVTKRSGLRLPSRSGPHATASNTLAVIKVLAAIVVAAIKVVDGGEAVSECNRAFGGGQNSTIKKAVSEQRRRKSTSKSI